MVMVMKIIVLYSTGILLYSVVLEVLQFYHGYSSTSSTVNIVINDRTSMNY